MKAVPFGDILAESCQLVGLDRTVINDKTFGAIRDLCSRRISQIWDREEWPDLDRYVSSYPGVPCVNLGSLDQSLVTQDGEFLVTDGGESLVYNNVDGNMDIIMYLDKNFPRIYLQDFEDNALRNSSVGSTKLNISNGFFIELDGGGTYDVTGVDFEFTYTTEYDGAGDFITSVTISVPYGHAYGFSLTANAKDNPTVIFKKNLQYIIKLPSPMAQGLSVWNKDPRTTSRLSPVPFNIEDFSIGSEDPAYYECTYLRVADSDQKFIKYRESAPRLTGIKFNPIASYSPAAIVYYDTGQSSPEYYPANPLKYSSGDFWYATANIAQAVTPALPIWRKIEIPRRFKDYLVNGVAADFLRSEGRADEANVFDQLAEASVQQQIDVYIRQQGQNQRMNMVYTY